MGKPSMIPILYIVATPIGHLSDISYRAVSILQQVDFIVAEDKRQSAKLLSHYQITTPMLSYHEHSDQNQTDYLLGLLAQGKQLALISDAGTPLISDPGYQLIRGASAQGVKLVPLPGACAAIAALSVSALPTDKFCFEGFLPAKAAARKQSLEQLVQEPRTLIFYEAPHRVVATVEAIAEAFGGQREICLAREVTKTFETIKKLPAEQMLQFVSDDADQQRGEIVLLVEGYKAQALDGDLPLEAKQLAQLLQQEMPPKSASKIVASHYGCNKKVAYDYLLSLKAS